MFISNLLFGKQDRKARQSIQTFNPVPRQELAEYNFNKSRVRYESGYRNSQLAQIAKVTFDRFKNNQPIDVLEASNKNRDEMYENVAKVVKKVLKSNYDLICAKYDKTNNLFCDPQFKPCSESIGKTFVRKNVEWKRISEVIPNAEFVSDTIQPEDILQGELGNCYFLSAIAALAQNDFRIKNIFPKLEINKNGFYMARILHLGVLQEVVVDDFIPVDAKGKPLFAKPSGGKEIWVMILEKCWAKLFGSYENIVGGLPNEVLHAFSGAPTFYYSMTYVKSQQEELFKAMVQASSQGSIMCCGTKSDPSIEKKGLVLGHAYTLIDVFEQPYRMLKIRNPWGEREWNGRASEMDMEFWMKMRPMDKDKLGHRFQNDGTFFMLWEDFVNYFAMVDICRINDNANYFYYQDNYLNDVPRLFQLQTSGGDAVISLSQPNLRGLDWKQKKKGYGSATLIIARQIKQGQLTDYEYIQSQADHSFPDFSLSLKNLKPGKYVVYASMLWTRVQSDYATVSVYTNSRIRFTDSAVNATQFLYKTYLDHARNNQQNIQVLYQQPYEWACSDLLTDKCGFGYLAFHLDKTSTRKIGLEINEKYVFCDSVRDYTDMKLELLAPYKGRGVFKVTAEPGKELIVMFRMIPGCYNGAFTLPVPKMFLLC